MRSRRCDIINGCGTLYKKALSSCPACSNPSQFSDDMGLDSRDWIYDIECYPNVFTISALHANTGIRFRAEISIRKNETEKLLNWLNMLATNKHRMVGFNNVGYDYPVLHYIIMTGNNFFTLTPLIIYTESKRIINTPWNNRYDNVIWDNETFIEQIDLFKIHHLDNANPAIGLKQLEFAMRMDNIKDLPFKPGTMLSSDEIDGLIFYNDHDVDATFKFYKETLDMIEFREDLSIKYDRSFLNFSDAKIGSEFVIDALGAKACYEWIDGKKTKRQTWRESIALRDAIFPYIKFNNPEFNRIKNYFESKTITETKGVFKDLTCTVGDTIYKFGTGGLHASVPGQTIYSNHEYVIVDVDVTSYYPSLGIVNRIYPEHLGIEYCNTQQDLKTQRMGFAKGTMENGALKLALNAGYGNSNQPHSVFYDPLFTMKITINGQLLLCMLAEWLMAIPDLKIIQGNTDGITYRCKRSDLERSRKIYNEWEKYTKLDLEEAQYSRMFIRDVNNYTAQYDDGKLKAKGAYSYEKTWRQDHSSLVIPKAVEANLIHGVDVREFITKHDNIFDFMCLIKAPKKSHLMLDGDTIQSTTRYPITITGGELVTVSPPTGVLGEFKKNNNTSKEIYEKSDNSVWNPEVHTKNKSVHKTRYTKTAAGWLCTECNDIKTANRNIINYEYYISEAMKLIEGVS